MNNGEINLLRGEQLAEDKSTFASILKFLSIFSVPETSLVTQNASKIKTNSQALIFDNVT